MNKKYAGVVLVTFCNDLFLHIYVYMMRLFLFRWIVLVSIAQSVDSLSPSSSSLPPFCRAPDVRVCNLGWWIRMPSKWTGTVSEDVLLHFYFGITGLWITALPFSLLLRERLPPLSLPSPPAFSTHLPKPRSC